MLVCAAISLLVKQKEILTDLGGRDERTAVIPGIRHTFQNKCCLKNTTIGSVGYQKIWVR